MKTHHIAIEINRLSTHYYCYYYCFAHHMRSKVTLTAVSVQNAYSINFPT